MDTGAFSTASQSTEMLYFISIDNDVFGPFSLSELKREYGKYILEDTMITTDTLDEWYEAKYFECFDEIFNSQQGFRINEFGEIVRDEGSLDINQPLNSYDILLNDLEHILHELEVKIPQYEKGKIDYTPPSAISDIRSELENVSHLLSQGQKDRYNTMIPKILKLLKRGEKQALKQAENILKNLDNNKKGCLSIVLLIVIAAIAFSFIM
ncbi:MAG: DUF4339 domain-containing protein [Marinilabiliaceae bacterium]|nr:DUF4339 domain-containing protein [Marinilabiliaceae bacterium]